MKPTDLRGILQYIPRFREKIFIIAIDGAMGIMGNGTFSNMMAYTDDDWRRVREQIQSTNTADKAKRS